MATLAVQKGLNLLFAGPRTLQSDRSAHEGPGLEMAVYRILFTLSKIRLVNIMFRREMYTA